MGYNPRSGSGYGNIRSGGGSNGFGTGKSQSRQSEGNWRSSEDSTVRFLQEPIAGIIKVDETINEFRFRVREPEGFSEFQNTDFDGELPEGVYVVRAKDSNGVWVTQSIRFKKEAFGFEQAQIWLRDNQDII